ncbi:MAG: DEAD/DEAH box helicase [Gemmatimonadales bacterium]
MAFSTLDLDKSLLTGLKELGFVRPTAIQTEAIPPALAGRDVLACAATGSGKTAAFMLPILHQLISKPRGTTRALVLTPTRELAAQILEHTNDLAMHTPVSAAAIFGGVGMGPQEHAFRSGVDIIVATPGRLLDHLRSKYAKLDKLEHLVLDEADRMLDMGFLPEIHRILKFVPPRRQTLFFSATMPPPILALTRSMLNNPASINLDRQATPATGITQAIYPVAQDLKSHLLLALLKSQTIKQALVFTRTKHRTNRVNEFLQKNGIQAERIHGNRSQAQRTAALAGFKDGTHTVLVATDIAARGIDVIELGHVVNFDVPLVPEDYIHRVGRTGRADAVGDAFTFVSPEEEGELRNIERAIGKRLPRVTVPDFDYSARPQGRLEVPLSERIAVIRARKAEDRARAAAKAARRTGGEPARSHAPAGHSRYIPREPSTNGAPARSGNRPGGNVSSGSGTGSGGPRRGGGGPSRSGSGGGPSRGPGGGSSRGPSRPR